MYLTVSSGFYGSEGSISPVLLVMGGVHGIEVTGFCRGVLWVARGVTQDQGRACIKQEVSEISQVYKSVAIHLRKGWSKYFLF